MFSVANKTSVAWWTGNYFSRWPDQGLYYISVYDYVLRSIGLTLIYCASIFTSQHISSSSLTERQKVK